VKKEHLNTFIKDLEKSIEDDIVVVSQFFSSENFKSHEYKMKFDVKGWDRGKYIGCITDESCEFKPSPYLRKFAMCMNNKCKNYAHIWCPLASFESEDGMPVEIPIGQGRVSHRF